MKYTSATIFLLLFCLSLPGRSAPTVGTVTTLTAGTIPDYGRFELSFPVTTTAASNFIPYDSVAPSYASALRANEDARSGVSVDELLLPPGQSDWSQALVWPCYWQQDFDTSGNPLAPSGSPWHCRYSPTSLGTWQYKIRATDSTGTVTTTASSFTCVAGASKGFVRVSPTDSRYFEYADGTPAILAGANLSPSVFATTAAAMNTVGAAGLDRVWLGADGGMGLYGGEGGNTNAHNISGYGAIPTDADAHAGRFSFLCHATDFPQLTVTAVAGTTYSVSFWYKAVNVGGSAVVSFPAGQQGFDRYWPPNPATSGSSAGASYAAPDGHGWVHATCTWTAPVTGQNFIRFGLGGATSGYLLIDDWTITNPAGGDLMGGMGTFEWHTDIDQAVAAQVDTLVNTATANGQYLKLVALNKFDRSAEAIAADATSSGASFTGNSADADLAAGGSGDPAADTPVQRFHRFYARYLTARWGYSTAIHSWEFANEIDLGHTLQYAGAQAFGAAMHSFAGQSARPVSTSTTYNGNGVTYATGLYENSAYPDIGAADFHDYPDQNPATGPFLPFADVPFSFNTRGSVPQYSGGPNGHGFLKFSLATQALGDSNNLRAILHLPTLRQAGTWTIDAWYRTSDDAIINQTYPPGVQVTNPFGSLPFPTSNVHNWTEFSQPFTVSSVPTQGSMIYIYGNLDPATPNGSWLGVGDVRIIAPDHRTFYRVGFDEPPFNNDSASLVEYLSGGKQSYSGDPAIGKPLFLGEMDLDLGIGGSAYPDPAVAQDAAGVFGRQAFWGGLLSPGALVPVFWSHTGATMTANNEWRFLAGVQAFLAGVPLSNGRYRDAGATASSTLRVIGQSDTAAGKAVLWVQNHGAAGDGSDAANWRNLTLTPSVVHPVSGSVTVPGLPDGSYSVQTWDTAANTAGATQTIASAAGVLTIPVTSLAVDEAFKVWPVASGGGGQQVSLTVTADKTVVRSGDTVVFTLAYANLDTLPVSGLTFLWPLPTGTTFVSASGGGSYNSSTGVISWSMGTIAPAGSGTVTLTVRVN